MEVRIRRVKTFRISRSASGAQVTYSLWRDETAPIAYEKQETLTKLLDAFFLVFFK